MIELIHLKIIKALAEHGSLTAAANAMFLTQSALSHQIRYLENKLDINIWVREGRKLRLTQAGQQLLKTARQVLPVVEHTEQTVRAYRDGKQGVLRIGVECHPCYEWLKTVVSGYLEQMPLMDVDIIDKFQFSGMQGLLNHHVDVLITPDEVATKGIQFLPLFDYELVLLVSSSHPLAAQKQVQAKDLANEVLLTFPVAQERLDVYNRFLIPAGVQPNQKQLQSLDIMTQLVQLGRGVTVLPDWLAERYVAEMDVSIVRMGDGLEKQLFAAIKQQDALVPYIQEFISLSTQ